METQKYLAKKNILIITVRKRKNVTAFLGGGRRSYKNLYSDKQV